ncbi:MAG: hypothetical protein DRQ55_07975 [Planctomycetota bacterium]|nr:MAG: hypothetical protein DRQ55_07975 [Planctomycetota bacterium]
MAWRNPLTTLAVLGLTLVALPACDPARPLAADPLAARPGAHLVLVSVDTLRADHLGCYGYERDTSPTLDRLAQQALLFEDVTATSSSTAPSHMSMFSGVLPRVHGIKNAVTHNQAPRVRLLAEILREQGYRTAAFADGGLVTAAAGFDRGFAQFDSRYEFFDDKLDRVQAWLDAAPDEPSFLFVHTYGVHAPYIPTRAHDLFTDAQYSGRLAGREYVLETRLREGRFKSLARLMDAFWEGRSRLDQADIQQLVGLYDGAIHRVDAGLGRLIEMLERKGWLDDAWLVITSDHGEAFREHGTFEHRRVMQEELAVPLLVRPPGGLPEGLRLSWPVTQLDLTPTCLAALGLPPEPGLQGRALWPLDAPTQRTRYASGGDGMVFDVVLEQGKKFILRRGEPGALYDLTADPGEQTDLLSVDPAPPWRALLERRLAGAIEASAALRVHFGDPQQGDAISDEQRSILEALGYLR